MKSRSYCLRVLSLIVFYMITYTVSAQTASRKSGDSFTFAFLTDIHVQPERNAIPGFSQAIDSVNRLHPDFVITGGDLIMDALGQRYTRADSLYNLYTTMIRRFRMPVYNTLGNHEIYGIYKKSGADPTHPEYGEKMFEKRLGRSYYAFEHKGWKFMILNSAEDTKKSSYIGLIDQTQTEWIREELKKTDPATPIVISTHIPFITAYAQRYDASTTPNDSGLVVVNSKQIIDLFKDHNLKLVLQGHLHTVEDILVDNVRYITAGAVSGAWWKGAEKGYEEGFMLISISGDDFTWRYVDYGWDVKKP